MTNPNGTLATYLTETVNVSQDQAHGREALSESLGLWMQYAIEKEDPILFEQSYAVLKTCFFAPEGYLYWKTTPSGKANVTVNALVDDLRIIDVLLDAEQKWGNREWGKTAQTIGQAVSSYLIKDGLMIDFYDHNIKKSPDYVTLSYINPLPLQKLMDNNWLEQSVYSRSLQLIRTAPNDGVFFPKLYNIKDRGYSYDSTINLIDQMLVAQYRGYIGVPSEELYIFLKKEFYEKGVIYGTYDRISRISIGKFESPAVYALIILYSLEIGDTTFAFDLYQKMVQFRTKTGDYVGGYVSDGQTHIFDNLYPQLAEIRLHGTGPVRLFFSRNKLMMK